MTHSGDDETGREKVDEGNGSLSQELRQIIDLLRNTDIVELQVENGQRKVFIRRAPATHEVRRAHSEELRPHVEEEVSDHLITVTAPMVGTFYQSTGPNDPPLVREGQQIAKGQVVGIIEAMKMMNEVESEHGGTVIKILVSSGQPVEYGHPLLLLEPDS